MNLLQALAYFVTEALSGLRRGWKASLLAITTIAVSLFLWGASMLVGQNLGAAMTRWRSEARLIVYAAPDASDAMLTDLERTIAEAVWVLSVERVTSEQAEERFLQAFPSLSDLMGDWNDGSLPSSLEVTMDTSGQRQAEVQAWLAALGSRPEVEMIDDDRDWIDQLEALAALARTVGLVVGLVLLAAATFTIASVVRLTAFHYQEEISIMRMVGATEFLIRGPFYTEGLLQGLFGSLLAAAGLLAAYGAAVGSSMGDRLLGELLLSGFLSASQILLLLSIGCSAGTLGALLSLRGETLAAEEPS